MSSIRFIMGRMKVCFFAVLCVGLETWNSLQNLKSKIKHGHSMLYFYLLIFISRITAALFSQRMQLINQLKILWKSLKIFWTRILSQKLRLSFLEMGFSWKVGCRLPLSSPLPKHTYALSNPYKINLFICLLIIPIRIDFCS